MPLASGSLTVSGEDTKKNGILRVHGMPTLENDSAYQVWVKRGQEVIPGSLFNVGQDGDGAAAVTENLDGRGCRARDPRGSGWGARAFRGASAVRLPVAVPRRAGTFGVQRATSLL